jgi:uncharacterized membrane protein
MLRYGALSLFFSFVNRVVAIFYRQQLFAALILAACFFIAAPAQGQFQICDRTSVTVHVAVSYLDQDGSFHTVGWLEVKPWQCATAFSTLTNRNYYVHAEEVGGGGRMWGDDTYSYCVQEGTFNVITHWPCDDKSKVGFTHVDVGAYAHSYAHTLTCTDCPPAEPETGNGFCANPACRPKAPRPTQPRQQWQNDLDWSIGNSTAGSSTDCPQSYPYPECVISGGRACLMKHAMRSARDNDCANALRVALITQCHNQGAANGIAAAGQFQVCQYLGPPDPPQPSAPPTPAPVQSQGAPHPVTFVNQSGMILYVYHFVGRVDCQNFTYAGSMTPQSNATITIPAGYTTHFVFQKAKDPCPVSTIRWEVSVSGGNPNPQNIGVP